MTTSPPFPNRLLHFPRCRASIIFRLACLLVVSLGSIVARGGEVDFHRDVLPLLQDHCIECHGADGAESDLRLDTSAEALRGGDSGEPAIVPGNADESYLIQRVTSPDPDQRMPPYSEPLSAEQVEILRSWISDEQHWQAAQASRGSRETDHWSFQPLQRPTLPKSEAENPIDAFVRAKLESVGLRASQTASRRRLIRRLYLVMHGMPPTPDQVQAFLNDHRPNAWERLVDEVLQSPRYGEQWATHWLDLVRFGETHGFETNRERPHAWRYRDWVIQSFNEDKSYDQFIIEQIAGDAVGADVATGFLVAGPYDLVKGKNVQLQQMQRQDELADIVNTTGTAFLGLTLGCARCHNHKFDPVTQRDYYAMQAVFAGVHHGDRALPLPPERQQQLAVVDRHIAEIEERLERFIRPAGSPGEATGRAPRPPVQAARNVEHFASTSARLIRMTIDGTNGAQPCVDELEIFAGDENVGLASAGAEASSSGDFEHPLHKLEHVNDGQYGNARSWIASVVSGGWVQIELPQTRTIDKIVWGRDREGHYSDRLATDYRFEVSVDGEVWREVASSADRQPLGATTSADAPYHFEGFPEPEAARGRADWKQLQRLQKERDRLSAPPLGYAGTFDQPGPTHRLFRGDPAAPREPVAPAAIAALSELQLPLDAPEQQRRLAIAQWIADQRNPLTARVIVNRLWQSHFGSGIVDTPSDFGGNGAAPSHPQLLDWLACELIDSGWSLKRIQRLILTSATWRQDSQPRADALAADADARWLWRFPPRRLQAEAIRDSMLAVAGTLDLRSGGPGFSAFQVEKENVRHYFPKTEFGPADWRRMVYMTKVRQERDAVFGVFDCPDGSQVAPKRSRSTTPLQALNLFNSRFAMQQADLFAQRLDDQAASPEAKVQLAYELCFSRTPQPDEVQTALAFIEQSGWQSFARAMLNASEFLFIP